MMETIEVSHTSEVSGLSKFISSALPKRALATASLRKYAPPLETSIMMRMTKIHTSSCTCTVGFHAQQDERDQRDAGDAVGFKAVGAGPTESPALSPVQSAITPGLRASSSLILKTIFIRSEPMSAILVKMPPAIRSAAAPSDSPMAKPMKQGPA
jgi:hypothetical protein